MNHNQDMGESWEEAGTPEYPEPTTALGIKYIVHADNFGLYQIGEAHAGSWITAANPFGGAMPKIFAST